MMRQDDIFERSKTDLFLGGLVDPRTDPTFPVSSKSSLVQVRHRHHQFPNTESLEMPYYLRVFQVFLFLTPNWGEIFIFNA
jgi:hypothetical protein